MDMTLPVLIIINCLIIQINAHCILSGQCGGDGICVSDDGKLLKIEDKTIKQQFEQLCPDLIAENNHDGVCCDTDQVTQLASQAETAAMVLSNCPSCYRNFRQLFCQLLCSPDQHEFVRLDKSSKFEDGLKKADAATFFATNKFADELYESCEHVTGMGGWVNAIDIACGSPCDPQKLMQKLAEQSPIELSVVMSDNKQVTDNGINYKPMYAETLTCKEPTPEGEAACPADMCPH